MTMRARVADLLMQPRFLDGLWRTSEILKWVDLKPLSILVVAGTLLVCVLVDAGTVMCSFLAGAALAFTVIHLVRMAMIDLWVQLYARSRIAREDLARMMEEES